MIHHQPGAERRGALPSPTPHPEFRLPRVAARYTQLNWSYDGSGQSTNSSSPLPGRRPLTPGTGLSPSPPLGHQTPSGTCRWALPRKCSDPAPGLSTNQWGRLAVTPRDFRECQCFSHGSYRRPRPRRSLLSIGATTATATKLSLHRRLPWSRPVYDAQGNQYTVD